MMLSTTSLAQEVYFAEGPLLELKSNQDTYDGFIIEYSSKNIGTIVLTLWKGNTLFGKGRYEFKKRGSNTVKMTMKVLNGIRLSVGQGYRYELKLCEQFPRLALEKLKVWSKNSKNEENPIPAAKPDKNCIRSIKKGVSVTQ